MAELSLLPQHVVYSHIISNHFLQTNVKSAFNMCLIMCPQYITTFLRDYKNDILRYCRIIRLNDIIIEKKYTTTHYDNNLDPYSKDIQWCRVKYLGKNGFAMQYIGHVSEKKDNLLHTSIKIPVHHDDDYDRTIFVKYMDISKGVYIKRTVDYVYEYFKIDSIFKVHKIPCL